MSDHELNNLDNFPHLLNQVLIEPDVYPSNTENTCKVPSVRPKNDSMANESIRRNCTVPIQFLRRLSRIVVMEE
jgi:hypothetical protein